jgi:hypothetical protein
VIFIGDTCIKSLNVNFVRKLNQKYDYVNWLSFALAIK